MAIKSKKGTAQKPKVVKTIERKITGHRVTKGHSLSTRVGIIDAGQILPDNTFVNPDQEIASLIESGHLEEVVEEKVLTRKVQEETPEPVKEEVKEETPEEQETDEDAA